MYLLSRQFVCDRLRLERRTSYRIINASHLSLINSDEIIEILNESKKGITIQVDNIPTDLRTPSEMASELGIDEQTLLTWTLRRTKNIPPHYRFNKKTIRYSAKMLTDWVELNTKRRPA